MEVQREEGPGGAVLCRRDNCPIMLILDWHSEEMSFGSCGPGIYASLFLCQFRNLLENDW